jgi:hypothetical protein
MLPSLGHFAVAIIGAGLAVGLFTVLNDRRAKEGKRATNPTIQLIIIIAIIMIFIGYLMG